jgi:hypothetical protein
VRKRATVLRRPAVRSRPAPPASPWLAHLRRRRAETDWSMCFALSVPLARSSFFSRGRTDRGRLKVLPKGEALLTEIRRFESRSLRQRFSFSQFRGCGRKGRVRPQGTRPRGWFLIPNSGCRVCLLGCGQRRIQLAVALLDTSGTDVALYRNAYVVRAIVWARRVKFLSGLAGSQAQYALAETWCAGFASR